MPARLVAILLPTTLFGLCVMAAPVPKERPEREVRLNSVSTTSEQTGLRSIPIGLGDAGYDDLVAIQKSLSNCRVSNVFLVRGDNIRVALRDTRDRLQGNAVAEKPAENEEREKSKNAWVFVSLGIAPSSPPEWTIERIEVLASRIVIRYSPIASDEWRTKDGRHHLYWVPLGELKAGTYVLELHDKKQNETTLLRRETIDHAK